MHALPNQFRLDGKVALVTGATAGMGRAIAIALADAGADVAVHERAAPPEDTAAAIAALGRRAATVVGDLSDAKAPAAVVRDAEAALGPLDIVFNNAGTIRRAPAAEHSDEDWDLVLAIDLSSAFRICREVGRRLIARNAPGKIINTCSLLSFQGGILVPSYTAAKGGLAQLTKALANEWAVHRINVNGLAPGYIATDNTAPLRADPVRSKAILDRIPAGRWGDPADVTGAAVFLASPASDYVTGHILVVDGGWMAR